MQIPFGQPPGGNFFAQKQKNRRFLRKKTYPPTHSNGEWGAYWWMGSYIGPYLAFLKFSRFSFRLRKHPQGWQQLVLSQSLKLKTVTVVKLVRLIIVRRFRLWFRRSHICGCVHAFQNGSVGRYPRLISPLDSLLSVSIMYNASPVLSIAFVQFYLFHNLKSFTLSKPYKGGPIRPVSQKSAPGPAGHRRRRPSARRPDFPHCVPPPD